MAEAIPILIADDEYLVRKGLRHLLQDQDEFEVIADASNGQEAVDKALELQPGIIIMDVKMPVLDGLAALEKLPAVAPLAKTIILSGYSDFQFAQKALKLGASDYLLKPVDLADLLAVLRRVKKYLLEERQQLEAAQDAQIRLNYSISAFMEQFYLQLLNGELSPEELAEKMTILDLKEDSAAVLLISLDHTYRLKTFCSAKEYQEINQSLRSCLEKNLADRREKVPPVLSLTDGLYAIMHFSSSDLEPVEFARKLLRCVKSQVGHTVSVAVGSSRPLSEIGLSYRESLSRMKQRLFLGGDRVIAEDLVPNAKKSSYPISLETKLSKSLRFGDLLQVKAILRELTGSLGRQGLPPASWHQLVFDIMEASYEVLRQTSSDPGFTSFPLEKSKEISQLSSISDIHFWLEKNLSEVAEKIRESSSGPSLAVKKALSFIEDHFAESIKLSDVAAQVCLSPNYLSQLFKQETRKTFVEHLSRRRVEEAKKLLTQSVLNVSEVAYRVGYENPRYFSEVFQKYEKRTPSQYRNSRPGGE